MRLLVSCIPYDGGKSGISVYVREVVRELAAQGHELTLLVEPGEAGIPSLSRASSVSSTSRTSSTSRNQGSLGTQSDSSLISAPRWSSRPALSMLWHLFCLPFWVWRHRREFDGFVICAANRRVCAWYPLPTVATVHDLANFHIPGKYSRLRMFYLAHVLPFFAKRAQHLVSVSGATKTDMVKYWHCREEDVTVLYNGLSGKREEGRGNGDCSQIAIDTTVHKSQISNIAPRLCASAGEENSQLTTHNSQLTSTRSTRSTRLNSQLTTILYISRIEHPGKNHVRLIEAYGKLPRSLAEAHPLVIAGADWKDAEVVHEAAAKSPHADLIRFTGFVEDLESLWTEAGFYVFPSLFEGFGLSLIEAMARGIPCACSGNGSLGEIAADVALTFNPESVEDIAEALTRLLTERPEDRAARIARGREHVKKFSWQDHAKGIARLLGDRT